MKKYKFYWHFGFKYFKLPCGHFKNRVCEVIDDKEIFKKRIYNGSKVTSYRNFWTHFISCMR